MEDYNVSLKFEKILVQMFILMGYTPREIISGEDDWGIDLVVEGLEKYYVQVKFYKSQNISSTTLKSAANKFAYLLKHKTDGSGIIVTSAIIPERLKNDILEEYGIYIWDRDIIYSHLTERSIEVRDQFEKLLLSVQQGVDTQDVFSVIPDERLILETLKHIVPPNIKPKYKFIPQTKGKELFEELLLIKCGRDQWSKYERKCTEILKFLFREDHLTLWEEQLQTEDDLSRFDLICRIASKHDYWKSLIRSFNTRFVLFEFKNYCNPIRQDQIYMTERYLYNKGLRSVGFIIAKNSANANAIAAAKGTLKENGKLILMLSNNDLEKMLLMKDNNEEPSDYLADLLDKWLVSLSR